MTSLLETIPIIIYIYKFEREEKEHLYEWHILTPKDNFML